MPPDVGVGMRFDDAARSPTANVAPVAAARERKRDSSSHHGLFIDGDFDALGAIGRKGDAQRRAGVLKDRDVDV